MGQNQVTMELLIQARNLANQAFDSLQADLKDTSVAATSADGALGKLESQTDTTGKALQETANASSKFEDTLAEMVSELGRAANEMADSSAAMRDFASAQDKADKGGGSWIETLSHLGNVAGMVAGAVGKGFQFIGESVKRGSEAGMEGNQALMTQLGHLQETFDKIVGVLVRDLFPAISPVIGLAIEAGEAFAGWLGEMEIGKTIMLGTITVFKAIVSVVDSVMGIFKQFGPIVTTVFDSVGASSQGFGSAVKGAFEVAVGYIQQGVALMIDAYRLLLEQTITVSQFFDTKMNDSLQRTYINLGNLSKTWKASAEDWKSGTSTVHEASTETGAAVLNMLNNMERDIAASGQKQIDEFKGVSDKKKEIVKDEAGFREEVANSLANIEKDRQKEAFDSLMESMELELQYIGDNAADKLQIYQDYYALIKDEYGLLSEETFAFLSGMNEVENAWKNQTLEAATEIGNAFSVLGNNVGGSIADMVKGLTGLSLTNAQTQAKVQADQAKATKQIVADYTERYSKSFSLFSGAAAAMMQGSTKLKEFLVNSVMETTKSTISSMAERVSAESGLLASETNLYGRAQAMQNSAARGTIPAKIASALSFLGPAAPFATAALVAVMFSLIDKLGGALKMNSGGEVPGWGAMDTREALLTPREFVMPKESAISIGRENLEFMRSTGQLPNAAGPVAGGRLDVNITLEVKGGYVSERRLALEAAPIIADALNEWVTEHGGHVFASHIVKKSR